MHVILNWFRILALPEVFFLAWLICAICQRFAQTKSKLPATRPAVGRQVLLMQTLAEAKKRLPEPHTHVVDFARSEIRVLFDGSVVAGCSVSGCDQAVLFGRDVHSLATPCGNNIGA